MIPWRKNGLPEQSESLLLEAKNYKDETIGTLLAMTDGQVTYLTDLYVEPAYRGIGIGSHLMKQFLTDEYAGGTTIILLTTEATGFYEKFGFTPRQAMVRRPDAPTS